MLAAMVLLLAASALQAKELPSQPAPKAAAPSQLTPAQGDADALLSRLSPAHPRLLLTPARIAELRRRSLTDPMLRDWRKKLTQQAKDILNKPPAASGDLPDGKRMSSAQRVVNQLQTLCFVHLLDPDPRYVARAWKEAEAAASLPDWNEKHFLDTAAMIRSLALALDWMHHDFSPQQRKTLQDAIVRLGLKPGIQQFKQREFWTNCDHNWNFVCNGGLILGALAVADTEPDIAREVLKLSLKSLPAALASLAPDGGWAEGPGYWSYGMEYLVLAMAAMDTALGTTAGLDRAPGLDQTALFPIYMTAPSGKLYNFADCHLQSNTPEVLWLAQRYSLPAAAYFQKSRAQAEPLNMIWYTAMGQERNLIALPRQRKFEGVQVASYRTNWTDPKALFLAFKGGDNAANHSHLDNGSFVLEAMGTRWAVDLGPGDYNHPHGYFDGRTRYDFYLTRAESHNTLVINPKAKRDQVVRATGKIISYEPGNDGSLKATLDLTPVYAEEALKVQRSFQALPSQSVTIRDEVVLKAPGEIRWNMHTEAEISLNQTGKVAELKQNGRTLLARLESPADATFTVLPALPLPTSPKIENQKLPAERVSNLAIVLQGTKQASVTVTLVPQK